MTPSAKHVPANNAGWMLTFADLLSLMLTFFVLVFSMNTIQFESWRDVVETMRDEFNPARTSVTPKRHDVPETITRKSVRGLNLNYLKALVERSLANNHALKNYSVTRSSDRVIISVPASGLFTDKNSQLQDGAVQSLEQLAGSLVQIRNRLTVSAHTNDLPVTNGLYRSNWELSVTRARVVAGIFGDAGYQQSITVLGHGSSKFNSLIAGRPTLDEQETQERIDIVIHGEGLGKGPFDVF